MKIKKITLKLEVDDNGHMFVSSPDVPGLTLSAPKAKRGELFADIGPALCTILSNNHGWPGDDPDQTG